jgi:hypothetical protein
VLLSEQEWPSAERDRVVSEGYDTDEITTRVSDVRKKGDPRWQSKETHPTSMCLQYEIISNGVYSPLPIRQRSVTDLSSPLLIGH